MLRFIPHLLASLLLCGCADTPTVDPSGDSSSSVGEQNDSPQSDSEDSTGTGTQTVQGDGFEFQAPAAWQVRKLSSGISVTSPTDLTNAIPGVPVSFALLPTQPALPPDALIASLIKSDKNLGEIESETVLDVSGRQSQKLIIVKAYPSYTNRTVKLYVPLDSKVLIAQVQGDDKHISPVQSEIDKILSSLTVSH